METGYFGGILDRHTAERLRPAPPWAGDAWRWAAGAGELFLHARGNCCRLFDFGPRAVLVRGHVVDTWSRRPSADLLAERLHQAYLEQGLLAVDGLEGSFTLALLDGEAGRVLLYRNLVGNGYTYYHSVGGGLLFASNLATLVEVSGETPRPSEDDLPTFFVNRNVPGRNTLFAGFHRLLPGEQVQLRDGRLTWAQRRTLGDLREDRPVGREALDRLEETMDRLCSEYAALDSGAANLLSGGVDSSFLQLHWDRARPDSPVPSRSFCVTVDHPRTRPDAEYALSAARILGTGHATVAADEPYAHYLLETMSATGEVPNHVQMAYFHRLARAMVGRGVTAALSAECADSLFGLATANKLQNAALLRRVCPSAFLRRGGAALAGLLRWQRLRATFRLADGLYHEERLDHPVNDAAVFTHRPSVEACFGREAVEAVASRRRALLDHYHVPHTPLERLHGAGFLGSAMNSASLMTTLFNHAGAPLFCPFLDSRMLRLVVNLSPRERFPFRRPKELLKRSLARHGHAGLAYRHKLGFGQPIFEWLAPGGQLRPLVEQIEPYDFLDARALAAAKARPNWFLYSLLCYDLWHKLHVSCTLPRSAEALAERTMASGAA